MSTKLTETDLIVQDLLNQCMVNDEKKVKLQKEIEAVQNLDNLNYFKIVKVLLEKEDMIKKGFIAMSYISENDKVELGSATATTFTKYYNLLNSKYPNKDNPRKRRVMINLVSLLVRLVLSYHEVTSNQFLTESNGKYSPSGKKLNEMLHTRYFEFIIDEHCLCSMITDLKDIRSFPTSCIYYDKKNNYHSMFNKAEIKPKQGSVYHFRYTIDKTDEEVCHDTDLSTEVMFVQPVSSLSP